MPYTWVTTHEELAQYLLSKESQQADLIQLLTNAGVIYITDFVVEDVAQPLTEIDPFTFFCYIYKHRDRRRLQVLRTIAGTLDLHVPEDDFGIPSVNALKVNMFPQLSERTNGEIQSLWSFFRIVVNEPENINNENFAAILKIPNVGFAKLTEVMFMVKPSRFLPLDKPVKNYLKSILSNFKEPKTYEDYQNLLNELNSLLGNKPFYEISYEATTYLHDNSSESSINYWLYAPGENANMWADFNSKGIWQ